MSSIREDKQNVVFVKVEEWDMLKSALFSVVFKVDNGRIYFER